MRLIVDSFCHQGKLRQTNQDALLVREDQGLFVVADGMGGHAGGEVASQLCVDAIGTALAALPTLDRCPVNDRTVQAHKDGLHAAITVANEAVHKAARPSLICNECNARTPAWGRSADDHHCNMCGRATPHRGRDLTGMGTTVVAALFSPGSVTLPAAMAFAHVGDSRCYHLRGGQLRQLTEDHSMLEAHVANGMPRDVAAVRKDAHQLTQAVGVGPWTSIAVRAAIIEIGDVVLLCSDGVHGELDAVTIRDALAGDDPAQALLDAVLAGGARDNLTGIVVRVTA